MSEHVTPSPAYPELHSQEKLPSVFVQAASSEQLSVSNAHSSSSLHSNDPTVSTQLYPDAQASS